MVYLVAASAGLAEVFAAALLVRLCLTFFDFGFAATPALTGVAEGAAAVIVAVGAVVGFAVATGDCAKDATATAEKTVAAIRDLIFNMV